MAQMSAGHELVSTIVSIVLSMVDFGLHVAVAIYMQVEYHGEHHWYWLFIVLALLANMVGIVGYVARSVGADAERPQRPSDLQLKFKQRPEECVIVLMLGMMNTECLCFLSREPRDHDGFRKLGLLSNVVEGLPMLGLLVDFVYAHGWDSGRSSRWCSSCTAAGSSS